MKKFLMLGLFVVSGMAIGQNYSAYSQLKPLDGSISDDMQQAQANTFRLREEKREIARIKYEREQKTREDQEMQASKEYDALERKAMYNACINSNTNSKILLYGGKDYIIFLGCLNCDSYNGDSIWNNYGKYGSKFNNECIWNKYGSYGGKYGEYSPFNDGAKYPPKIIDDKGNFMGYFTSNKYFTGRREGKLADAITEKWEAIGDNILEMTKPIHD